MSDPEIYQETGTPDMSWVTVVLWGGLPVTAETAWRHLRDLLATPLDSPAPEAHQAEAHQALVTEHQPFTGNGVTSGCPVCNDGPRPAPESAE